MRIEYLTTKKLTIVNPRDTANIEDFLNDYIFVSELKKYFGGISFAAANYSTKLGISKGNNSPLQRLIDLKSESLSAFDPRYKDINNLFNSSINSQCNHILLGENSNLPKNEDISSQISQGLMMKNAHSFLLNGIDKFRFENSISKAERYVSAKKILLTGDKNLSNHIYSPCIELFGYSLAKHVLANTAYFYSLQARIKNTKDEYLKKLVKSFSIKEL